MQTIILGFCSRTVRAVVALFHPHFVRLEVDWWCGRDLDDLKSVLECPGSLRVHANWFNVDTGDIPLDDKILEILLSSTKSDAQRLDEWIESNPDRVETYVPSMLLERLSTAEGSCSATTCAANEYVQDGSCVACSEGQQMKPETILLAKIRPAMRK